MLKKSKIGENSELEIGRKRWKDLKLVKNIEKFGKMSEYVFG